MMCSRIDSTRITSFRLQRDIYHPMAITHLFAPGRYSIWSRRYPIFQIPRKRTTRKYSPHVSDDSIVCLYYGSICIVRNDSIATNSNYHRYCDDYLTVLCRPQTFHPQQKGLAIVRYQCSVVCGIFCIIQKMMTSRKQSLSSFVSRTYRSSHHRNVVLW